MPVVFAGYGIRAPEAAHDDYAGLDVRGKAAVLVWTGEPPGKEGRSAFSAGRISRHALVSTKIEAAQRAGASLMLVAKCSPGKTRSRKLSADPSRQTPVLVWVVAGAAPPVVYVEEQLVSAWFAVGGVDSGSILSTATPGNPVGRPLSGIQVGLEWAELKTVTQGQWNGGGFAGPESPGEPVVLSAHYDHIGYDREADGSLTIYPGADDNASGVAALLGLPEP